MLERFQQFEVWQIEDGHWEMISSFRDLDVASAVTKNKQRVRLLKVTYENAAAVEQEVLAEVGDTRIEP